MKQEVLASGICVPSYLSRIENGLVTPSDDIQQHLLNRLGIPMTTLNEDLDIESTNHFRLPFKDVINSRNKLKAEQLFIEVHSYIEEHPINPNRLTLLLIETRIMLMLPTKQKDLKTSLAILEEFKKEMNTEQLFYLYTIQGIVAYQNNLYHQASEIFNKTSNLIKSYRMEDWEMAELYYISSLALISESRYISAIDYVKSALSYFNQEILIERSIECLIILGIAQKNTGVLKEAIATYAKAREISLKIDSQKFTGMIEHNMGACYSKLGQPDKALSYYHRSLESKTSVKDKIVTVLTLLHEYHKNEDYSNAKIWLEKGYDLLHEIPKEIEENYRHHFLVFRVLLYNERNIIPFFKEVINYFESKELYRYCWIYCNVLAKKLAEDKSYKQATIYYELGLTYYNKYSNVTTWEELL